MRERTWITHVKQPKNKVFKLEILSSQILALKREKMKSDNEASDAEEEAEYERKWNADKTCAWENCNETFLGGDALSAHLNDGK
jgi:hypothetical protein